MIEHALLGFYVCKLPAAGIGQRLLLLPLLLIVSLVAYI